MGVHRHKTVPPGPDENNILRREYGISAVIHTARNSVNNININNKSPCDLKHLLNHLSALYTLKKKVTCALLNTASCNENIWNDEVVSSHIINPVVDKLLASRPICFILGRESPIFIKYESA